MSFRTWVKTADTPVAAAIRRAAKGWRGAAVPMVPAIHRPLYRLNGLVRTALHEAARMAWYTPLFQSRLRAPAKNLYVYSGIPQVLGNLEMTFGRDCTISGMTTLTGRAASVPTPQLIVGDNTEIGYQTTIAVGRRVLIGNNVMIAGRCFLAGYPGHPLDPADRAAHKPDTDEQTGDIILEDDVWLATGVTVMAGVRIGRGSIVTAGSVVFRDVPPGVIVTGNPARVAGPIVLADRAARAAA